MTTTAGIQFQYTPLEEINKINAELTAGFRSGKTKSIAFRKFQLLQLAYLIKDNVERFEQAFLQDLGRGQFEAHFLEISVTCEEIMHQFKNVEKWSKPDKVPFNLKFLAMTTRIHKEPKGVALIISSFNYPFFVGLNPMAAAIASGCAVALKPSEQTPAISSLLAELVPRYLDSSLYRVINGGIAEMSRILELQWGHIMFTGSGRVGSIVAIAAAKNLTPVTLELGGKSPAFIDTTCNLQVATKRLLWGAFVNAGQTCIAPDYVMVPRSFLPTFLEALKKSYAEMYADPKNSISRIVSPQAFHRLKGLLDATKGKIVLGGECIEAEKYIAPTVITDVTSDDSLMSMELFGPLLPIMAVEDVDEALAYVNAHDHPLAIYVFSNDQKYKDKVRKNTLSGAIQFNDTLVYTAIPGTPFGGVGPSGSGGYHHGKHGFETFIHFRTAVENPYFTDIMLKLRYPPFTTAKVQQSIRMNMPKLPKRVKGPEELSRRNWRNWVIFSLVGALMAFFASKRRNLAN